MARIDVWRTRCRVLLAVFYGVAGILHIAIPEPFLTITPAWVPQAEAVILLTGLCEIAGAIGLLVPPLRRYAAIGLALYAVCVSPPISSTPSTASARQTSRRCNGSITFRASSFSRSSSGQPCSQEAS